MGNRRDTAEEDLRSGLSRFNVKILDVVKYYSRTPPCYRCGRLQECSIGGGYRLWGDKAHTLAITPELFSRWEDDSETIAKIEAAAEKLRRIAAIPTQI
jgi:hypothetical protein